MSAETLNLGTYFDVRKSQNWYNQLKKDRGAGDAFRIALPVLAEDLYSQAWELIDTQRPYVTKYYIRSVNGERRLVHESDLYCGKDILDGIDKSERRGLVYAQIAKAKNRILKADTGEAFYWISPKQDKDQESRNECNYTDTFINKAEIGSDGEVFLSQNKSSNLDTKGAINLLKKFDPILEISENDLNGLLLSIGSSKTPLTDSMINQAICKLTNIPILSPDIDMESVKKRAEYKAIKYLRILETETSPEILARLHAEILLEVVDNSPSSRIIRDEFGVRIRAACSEINMMFRSSAVKGLYSGSEEKVEYHRGDCEKCKRTNREVGPCNICKDCE